jgi:hypothetical protein
MDGLQCKRAFSSRLDDALGDGFGPAAPLPEETLGTQTISGGQIPDLDCIRLVAKPGAG